MTARTISSTVKVNKFRAECEFLGGMDDLIKLNLYDDRTYLPGYPPVPFLNMSRSDLADLKEAIQRAVHDA